MKTRNVVLAAAIMCLAAMAGSHAVMARRLVPRPDVVVVSMMSVDSATITLQWPSVKDARGDAVTRYLWRLVNVMGSGPVVLASDSTSSLADTVKVARPLPGDSLILQGLVAARDRRGLLSSYGSSNRIVIPGKPWVPPSPPSPNLDTLAFKADSAKIILALGGHGIKDGVWQLQIGDTVELCGYSWKDEVLRPSLVVRNWQPSDPGLKDLGVGSIGSFCERFWVSPSSTITA